MIDKIINSHWTEELALILIYFVATWIVSLILKRIIRVFMKYRGFSKEKRKPIKQRNKTLSSLITSAINLMALLAAILLSLSIYISMDTLAWMVGLFSAAFGLGARPLISDFMSGISLIFEDIYSVGEKVEIEGMVPIEGVVETINLRTTTLRAPTGELYVIPNGEIRTVRNFARGKFSTANITIKISTCDVGRTTELLENLAMEAVTLIPNLIEPWQVIGSNGAVGTTTELTVIARARFGKAAEMKPRILNLVHERLAVAEIQLAE